MVGQSGIEPETSANVFAATLPLSYCPLCYGCTSIAQFEGGADLTRYAPASGIFRPQEPQGGFGPHYVTGAAALSQPIPRPRHRAAAYLRVPSVRLSSVTDFRFATAFSPCGGAGLSRLSRVHGFTLSSCLLWRAALSSGFLAGKHGGDVVPRNFAEETNLPRPW